MKDTRVKRSLTRVIRGRNVSLEVERSLRNSILLPTLTDHIIGRGLGCSSQECVVEMSYQREACGMTRWEDESNKSMYEKCEMGACANRVQCGLIKLRE